MLYEVTYMFRGHSGIPKDTLEQAKILNMIFPEECNLVVNPNSYVPIWRLRLDNRFGNKSLLSKVFEVSSTRSKMSRTIENVSIVFDFLANLRARKLITLNPKLHKLLPAALQRITEKPWDPYYMLPVNFKSRYVTNLFRMPAKVDTKGFDYFIQQSLLPIRVSEGTNLIVRLHDILPVTHPEFFSSKASFLYRRSMDTALKDPNTIWVVNSKATESDFKSYYGNNMKTQVVYCTISGNYDGDFERKEKSIVILATIEPRKRIDVAVQGFLLAQKNGSVGMDWKLIVAGSYGWKAEELYRTLKSGGYGSTVLYSEGPTDSEVLELFERSSIVLCTSNNEGFSRPPLEGMLYGCLPVVTDIAQHRETMGELGFYIDGSGVDSVAAAISNAVAISNAGCIPYREKVRDHVRVSFSEAAIGEQWRTAFKNISLGL
jgi:glycosyltransferase involved in cell wall biosynthesis